MKQGNYSQTQERKNSLYQAIREKGKDVYSVNYYHCIWKYHQDQWVDDTYIFLLPERQNTADEGIELTNEDIGLLKDYSKQLFRTRIPVDDIESGRLKVEPVTEISLNTLEELTEENVVLLRRY